uniref:Uncharacterized protein n=1 Tax=Arundo donax TaxID=35708 RepID=A0A0A9C2M7_ARUDO
MGMSSYLAIFTHLSSSGLATMRTKACLHPPKSLRCMAIGRWRGAQSPCCSTRSMCCPLSCQASWQSLGSSSLQ